MGVVCGARWEDVLWYLWASCPRLWLSSPRVPSGGMSPAENPENSRDRQKSSFVIPYQLFLVLFQ